MVLDSRTSITLDLRLTGPVEGHVGAVGQEPRAFSGYAGLIAALESIRLESVRGGERSPEEASR